MIPAYLVLAGRIRNELNDLERVVERVDRAIYAARKHPEEQDFFVDSVALNLHDIYSGLERIFQQIAATVDSHVPDGRDWHRELLDQMKIEVVDTRPAVLSGETILALDELLRFRHVVRNVYTFSLDFKRIVQLAVQAHTTFEQVKAELMQFATFLERAGK
jgi:hypothetical protein